MRNIPLIHRLQFFHGFGHKLHLFFVLSKLAPVVLGQEVAVPALAPRSLQHIHVRLAHLIHGHGRYHRCKVDLRSQGIYLPLYPLSALGVARLNRIFELVRQLIGLLQGVQRFICFSRIHAGFDHIKVLLRVLICKRFPPLVVVHARVLGRAVSKHLRLYARPSVRRIHRVHEPPVIQKCAVLQQLAHALICLFYLAASCNVSHSVPEHLIPALRHIALA